MLGGIHPFQLLVVLIVALLVFGGRGRISNIMGDLGKGIRSFRKGMAEDEAKPVTKEDMVDVTPEKDKTKSTS